jgi:hypothetical protein
VHPSINIILYFKFGYLFSNILSKYSASQIFRLVKSITALQLFENYPELKKELWTKVYSKIPSLPKSVNADNYFESIGKKEATRPKSPIVKSK